MKFKQPECLNCSALIEREEIDMSTDVAICKECNTIYKFSNLLYSGQDKSHKLETELHNGFLYEDFRLIPAITLELKKLSNYKFYLIAGIASGVLGLVFLFIPDMIFKLVGVLTLMLVGHLFKEAIYRYNTVYTVELGDDSLKVNRNGITIANIQSEKISQVYVKRRNGGSSGSTVYYEHDIYLRPKSGEDIRVMKNILPSSVAFEIERIIEEKYGIEDIITKEEYHPKYSPQGENQVPSQILYITEQIEKVKKSKD